MPQDIWETVKIMQKKERVSNSKHNPLQAHSSYAILCGLADYLFGSSLSLSSDKEFWEMIQHGLVQDDSLSRKRSMYLLKKTLEECQVKKDVQCLATPCSADDCPLFWWSKDESSQLMSVWKDYVLLMETLEEKQVKQVCPCLSDSCRQ